MRFLVDIAKQEEHQKTLFIESNIHFAIITKKIDKPARIEITIENPNEIPSIFKKNKSISTRSEFKLVKIEKTES